LEFIMPNNKLSIYRITSILLLVSPLIGSGGMVLGAEKTRPDDEFLEEAVTVVDECTDNWLERLASVFGKKSKCFELKARRSIEEEEKRILSAYKRLANGVALCENELSEGVDRENVKCGVCPTGVYEGEVKNGKRNGKGTFYYSWGALYCGEWKDDRKHGKGKFTTPDGLMYDGDWVDDMRHGKGEWFNSWFGTYYGEWEDDHITGEGTLIDLKGVSHSGKWDNGVLKK
jgi:hypothetical protein